MVRRGAALTVEVVDDGAGAAPLRPGVGLLSMAERAAELGGTCEVAPAPGGGTAVRLRLPLPVAVPSSRAVGVPAPGAAEAASGAAAEAAASGAAR